MDTDEKPGSSPAGKLADSVSLSLLYSFVDVTKLFKNLLICFVIVERWAQGPECQDD